MSLTDRIWKGVKLLLSCVLVLAAAIFIFAATVSGRITDPALFGVVGFFLFLAAIPWVSLQKPSRAFGLIAVLISIGIFWLAYETLSGGMHFPADCSPGRGQLGCYAINELYDLGGSQAVGAVWILFGLLTFAAALALFARSRHAAQQAAQDTTCPKRRAS